MKTLKLVPTWHMPWLQNFSDSPAICLFSHMFTPQNTETSLRTSLALYSSCLIHSWDHMCPIKMSLGLLQHFMEYVQDPLPLSCPNLLLLSNNHLPHIQMPYSWINWWVLPFCLASWGWAPKLSSWLLSLIPSSDLLEQLALTPTIQ